ncbi:MAG: hypothetical protein ACOCTG_01340, partial [Bacteroidota bacterium]
MTSLQMRFRRCLSLLLLASLAWSQPDAEALAQPREEVRADSVLSFFSDPYGEHIEGEAPERSTALHPTDWLRGVPHGFVYAFRTAGWPEGWSPFGFAPSDVLLRRDGYPYVSLTTGRSALEMLPFGLMAPLRLDGGADDGAVILVANTQTFDQARPITGLRYQTDNLGLQYVEAFHAQRRRITLLGRAGNLNLTAAYLGRGSTG